MALSLKVHALGTKNDAGEDCKGNVSIYGLNARFPITLYANQWRELARVMPSIIKLVEAAAKEGKLSTEAPKKGTSANGKISL